MSVLKTVIVCVAAIGVAASALAETDEIETAAVAEETLSLGTVQSFKKGTVRARTEGGTIMLRASEMQFPLTIVAEIPDRQQIAFTTADGETWVRLGDVETQDYGTTQDVKCVSTRIETAENDSELGATQMGAGIARCGQ